MKLCPLCGKGNSVLYSTCVGPRCNLCTNLNRGVIRKVRNQEKYRRALIREVARGQDAESLPSLRFARFRRAEVDTGR